MSAIQVDKIIKVIESDATACGYLLTLDGLSCVAGGLLLACGVRLKGGRAACEAADYAVLFAHYALREPQVDELIGVNDTFGSREHGTTKVQLERRRSALVAVVRRQATSETIPLSSSLP